MSAGGLKRRRPSRNPRRRILIVTEGQVTEPEYILGLRRHYRLPLVELKVVGGAGVPKTVVEKALELLEESRRDARREKEPAVAFAAVWCVFDVDNHPFLPEALQHAAAHKIQVALSNPCIELWLLLHWQDHSAHIDRAALRQRMRAHVSGYDKHVDFPSYEPCINKAVARAQGLRIRAKTAGNSRGNPTTDMDLLVEMLRAEVR